MQPVIANQVIELDSRPDLPDPALLPPGPPNRFGVWPDTSGNNVQVDAAGDPLQPTWEENGWDPTGRAIGAVDINRAGTANTPHMNIFDGGFGLGYGGNFLTLFFVCEATDLSNGGVAIIGGNAGGGGGNMRNLFVTIEPDGSVQFGFFDTGSGENDTVSAPGFVAEGDRVQITCQHWAAGRTIRLNGTVIATSTGTGHLIVYPTMFLGRFLTNFGERKKIAWYSGHNAEITDAEVLEMEAFLRGAFFTPDPPPPTQWAP